MGTFDALNRQLEMAHQGLDDGAAQDIVGIELNATMHRQHGRIQPVVVFVQRFDVLVVGRANLADRRNAEGQHVAVGIGRVALEITVQTSLSLSHRQLIIRFGKMIHADEDITRVGQFLDRQRQNLQALLRCWQIGVSNPPLWLEQARQVGIVVDRQTIGVHCQHPFQGPVKTGHGLVRQAVDKIHRHRFEATGARRANHVRRFFLALYTIHGDLHPLVKILHADAHAVETQLSQQGHRRRINLARIDLDRILPTIEHLEVLARLRHQLAHFIMRQEGRRPPTPMQLDHFMLTPLSLQGGTLQSKLLAQVFEVLRATPVILGNDLVTSAVIADGVTEGDVEV